MTADGRLRNCLFAKETLDLRKALREDPGDRSAAALFRRAVAAKPEGHDLDPDAPCPGAAEPMSRVGG